MNPEEQFARLKCDDDRWENTSFATAAPAASVERRRLPLWGQLTIGIAAGLVVGLVVTLGVSNLRHDALPPAQSPSPTPGVPGAIADDGYVMNRPFAEHFDFDATAPEPSTAIGDNGSAPWAVITAAPDALSLSIAYVSSGDLDFCGVHQGVDVVESASAVTITVVNDAVAADVPCTEGLRIGMGTVALQEPLGDRTLYHGPLTHPWDAATSPLITVDPAVTVPDVGTTCDDFLYDQTKAEFADNGLSLRPKESYNNNRDGYAGEILDGVAEGAGESTWASGIVTQYGGLACRWEAGESYLDFGSGPITDEQSVRQQERLAAAGWLVDPDYPYPLLYKDGTNENYAFGDGWWAYENNQSGTGSQLYEIIATSSHPEAFATGEPDTSDTPSMSPPADPDAYITTAGYGDLKVGQRVPESTNLMKWFPDDCYAGRWGTPGSDPNTEPIIVRTTNDQTNDRSNRILWISVRSPEIKTKSGAHVGMSLTDLKDVLPDGELSSGAFYVIADDLGQVVFELAADSVISISVIGPGDTPFGTQGTDTAGACYGA